LEQIMGKKLGQNPLKKIGEILIQGSTSSWLCDDSALYGKLRFHRKTSFIGSRAFHLDAYLSWNMPIHQIATKFNVIWMSSCHLNTIEFFTFKKIKSHPVNDDHTNDTNTIYFFHFIDISIGSSLSQNFMLKSYTHHTQPLPYGKGQWTFKGWKFNQRVTPLCGDVGWCK
jgi:hypothetical protein